MARKSNGVTQEQLYTVMGEHREAVFGKLETIRDEIHQVNLCFTGEAARLAQADADQITRLNVQRTDINALEGQVSDINKRDRWLSGLTILISGGFAGLIAWLEGRTPHP